MSYPRRIASGITTLNVCRTVVFAIRPECRIRALSYAVRAALRLVTLTECRNCLCDTNVVSHLACRAVMLALRLLADSRFSSGLSA
jgi:hypothetical protein